MPIINCERKDFGWSITTEMPDHSATYTYTRFDDESQWMFGAQPLHVVCPNYKSVRALLEEVIREHTETG